MRPMVVCKSIEFFWIPYISYSLYYYFYLIKMYTFKKKENVFVPNFKTKITLIN